MPTISRWCACLSWALWLFQFCEDFIGTHTAGQQLLQHFFGLCLLCFFGSLGVCDRLFPFQRRQLFLGGLESSRFLFQVSFQSVDVCSDRSDFRCEANDRFLLLCDSRCKVGGELRFILAAFRSGHYCVPPYHNVFVFSFKSEGFISKKSNLKLSIRLAGMLNLF